MEITKYKIEYLTYVLKEDLSKLDSNLKKIIKRKLDRLISEPFLGVALKKELIGYYKLKVSKYRIVYRIFKEENTILIVSIGKRDKSIVYREALKRVGLKRIK